MQVKRLEESADNSLGTESYGDGWKGEPVHALPIIGTRDTIAREAELVIEHVPIRVMCQPCKKPFNVDKKEMSFFCPDCGEKGATLLQGRGFKVKSIEILNVGST